MGSYQPLSEDDNDWDIIPDDAPVKFDSSEHSDISTSTQLRAADGKRVAGDGWVLKSIDTPGNWRPWTSAQRVDLTFSNVIAIAGDFYGNTPISNPISWGTDHGDRQKRFDTACKNLETDNGNYLALLCGVLKGEQCVVDTKKNKSLDYEIVEAYESKQGVGKEGMPTNDDFSSALGGPWYGSICLYNFDHFGTGAEDAYIAGHSRALELARKAKTGPIIEREKGLKDAYFKDAFALHFLSDLFSTGHIRQNRKAFHNPSLRQMLARGENLLFSFISSWLAEMRTTGGWDGMSEIVHGDDNTCGLRVKNRMGQEWIAFGDGHFFSGGNRVNKLRSIACIRASMDEVYEAFAGDKELPEPKNARNEVGGYKALRLNPLPFAHHRATFNDDSGQPVPLWAIEGNEPPYTFYRRPDPNSRVNNKWQKGDPGFKDFSLNPLDLVITTKASDDVNLIEGAKFKKSEADPIGKPIEITSGGFIQIQEYQTKPPLWPAEAAKGSPDVTLTEMNHAVNVWGPVNVPAPTNINPALRQFTFTLRSRTPRLRAKPENYAKVAKLRWLSSRTVPGKTSIVQFCVSNEDGGVVAESFSLTMGQPEKNIQWINYEDLDKFKLLFGTKFDKDGKQLEQQADFDRTLLVKGWSIGPANWKYQVYAQFFVFPFRKAASLENPDIVAWVVEAGSFDGVAQGGKPKDVFRVNVMSTERGLMNPKLIFEGVETKGFDLPLKEGFVKPFAESVGDRDALLLHVRARGGNGKTLTVYPVTTKMVGDKTWKTDIPTAPLTMPCYNELVEHPTWQALVGDVRACSYQEMLIIAGVWPAYSLGLYNFNGTVWQTSVSPGPTSIPGRTTNNSRAFTNAEMRRHYVAVLMQNESHANGLNLVMVTSFKRDERYYLNIRTYIKDGPDIPAVAKDIISTPVANLKDITKISDSDEWCWGGDHSTCCKKPKGLSPQAQSDSKGPSQATQRQPIVERPKVLFKEYVDCPIEDKLIADPYYKTISWHRISTTDGLGRPTSHALMQVFSWYGVIGCRVFAPTDARDYSTWAVVGEQAHMGQSSLGIGSGAGVHWNNVMPWGPSVDFIDSNVYTVGPGEHESWGMHSCWENAKNTRGWDEKEPGNDLRPEPQKK